MRHNTPNQKSLQTSPSPLPALSPLFLQQEPEPTSPGSQISPSESLKRNHRRALFALVISGALLSAGCLSGPGGGVPGDLADGVSVGLTVRTESLGKTGAGQGFTALRPVDSAFVRITASDMDSVHYGFSLDEGTQSLTMIDIPPGTDRRFDVSLYHDGRLLYSGSVTAELRTDRANALTVTCLPEFSRIAASIHIPVDFPMAVAGGILRVQNDSLSLSTAPTVSGELRNFRLEDVPGDRDYTVYLALWGPEGDTIATAFRSGVRVPKGQNMVIVMPLTLAFTQIALTMTVGDPLTTTLVLSLPGGRRLPTGFGDAVFSEFYAVPTAEEGGDNGEWLEVFNRVADTLDLSGCQLIRDAGTGTGMNFVLPANTVVPPGRGLVVGRSAVSFAQIVQASSLTLTNTSARLELSCAGSGGVPVRVDTLRYGTSVSDSLAARITAGKVSSLKASRLATRHKADAWCLASPNPAATEFVTTPGGIIGGCGE